MQLGKKVFMAFVLALLLMPASEVWADDAFAGTWVVDIPATREYRLATKEQKGEIEKELREAGFTEGLFTILAGMALSLDPASHVVTVSYKGHQFFSKEYATKDSNGFSTASLDNNMSLIFVNNKGIPQLFLRIWPSYIFFKR